MDSGLDGNFVHYKNGRVYIPKKDNLKSNIVCSYKMLKDSKLPPPPHWYEYVCKLTNGLFGKFLEYDILQMNKDINFKNPSNTQDG